MMTYSAEFFRQRRATTLASSQLILDHFWKTFEPKTVLDLGCATGIWLSEAKKRGAKSIKGIDGAWVPADDLEIEKSEFLDHDFTKTFPDDIGHYDAAFCIEVAEHLSPEAGEKLIRFLTTHADIILFSAAVPGQGGTGHVNEQLQSFWYEKFNQQGFECFDIVRPKIWNDHSVNVIYKQNMLVYVRASSKNYENVFDTESVHISENNSFRLDRIHPELFELRSKKSPPTMLEKTKRTLRDFLSK